MKNTSVTPSATFEATSRPNQTAKKARSRNICQKRRLLLALLAGIAFEHFFLHGAPDEAVQLHKPRREADFRHVARPRQVDGVLADRPGFRSRRKHHDAVGER